MKIFPTILIMFSLAIIFNACSATSTGSRYEKKKEEEKKEEKDMDFSTKTEEDFDITPYRTKIEIEDIPNEKEEVNPDLWYGYEDSVSFTSQNKEVVETIPGYRVQVIATDNLEEANSIRSEIYFKINKPDIYIDFDPPFYKVKVGDFQHLSDANEMNFKLTQMGYTDSRVISETINIFQ